MISAIITDQTFLDVCVRLARMEERINGLFWLMAAIVAPIIISVVQNYFLHKQIKNGNVNEKPK